MYRLLGDQLWLTRTDRSRLYNINRDLMSKLENIWIYLKQVKPVNTDQDEQKMRNTFHETTKKNVPQPIRSPKQERDNSIHGKNNVTVKPIISPQQSSLDTRQQTTLPPHQQPQQATTSQEQRITNKKPVNDYPEKQAVSQLQSNDPKQHIPPTQQYVEPNLEYEDGSVEQYPQQEYDPSNQYDPNQQYDPNETYDPNQEYDPNQQYDPNQEYDPNQQYDPNQEYDPNQHFEQYGDDPTQYPVDPNDPRHQYSTDPNNEINYSTDPGHANQQFLTDPNTLSQQYGIDPTSQNQEYAGFDASPADPNMGASAEQ
ncbi:hypothetical protein NQ318_013312 [Aromia moschata]|uniref:Uncharacterized protein n=1 Tax=Aromia moschata TaxID=1265417 RepID=A0AAV8XZG0_9CUCU|nr:hypothetical protein NQ318_013312 [Aromia moschata]